MENRPKNPKLFLTTGVIGNPIAHSLSPIIHNWWIQKSNLSAVYKTYKLEKNELDGFVEFAKNNMLGFNVTTPHKQNIVKYCSSLSQAAMKIGAVNTVVIKNKKLFGDNTDAYGFKKCLEINTLNVDLNYKKAIIIGAGGAARAIVFALIEMKFKQIIIINRTLKTAQNLAEEFNIKLKTNIIKAEKLEHIKNFLPKVSLLVNATICGMNNSNNLILPLEKMPAGGVVFDIVYCPLTTELLATSKNHKLNTVQGIDMLLYQAISGFKQFFSEQNINMEKITVDNTLRQKLLKHLDSTK